MNAMSSLAMEIYDFETGVLMTLRWENEEEYRLGQAFLHQLAGDEARVRGDGGKPDSYYLESKQQVNALHDFRRDLRDRRKGGAA